MLVLLSSSALAHSPSESFSTWQWQEGRLTATFTVTEREVTRLARHGESRPLSTLLQLHLEQLLEPDPDVCASLSSSSVVNSQRGWLTTELVWPCSAPPASLKVGAFFELAAEHTHYVTYTQDGDVRQHVLTRDRLVWFLAEYSGSSQSTSGVKGFFISGLRHVSLGADHLVFLLALVLVFKRKRDIVFAVTGFTLGHMLALAAIALGTVVADRGVVEALIGLTVCMVSVEYFRERGVRLSYPIFLSTLAVFALVKLVVPSVLSWQLLVAFTLLSISYLEFSVTSKRHSFWRVALTLLFGLVHGAGFASGFVIGNVSNSDLWPAIIGFNLGIEVGQLAFVAAALLVFSWIGPGVRRPLQDGIITLVFGAGVYWFFARGFPPAF